MPALNVGDERQAEVSERIERGVVLGQIGVPGGSGAADDDRLGVVETRIVTTWLAELTDRFA